jgi:hypothetical protein
MGLLLLIGEFTATETKVRVSCNDRDEAGANKKLDINAHSDET